DISENFTCTDSRKSTFLFASGDRESSFKSIGYVHVDVGAEVVLVIFGYAIFEDTILHQRTFRYKISCTLCATRNRQVVLVLKSSFCYGLVLPVRVWKVDRIGAIA